MSTHTNLVIKNGRVIDPANDLDQQQDLYITDGKILAIGRAPAGFKANSEIDASGQIVCPGFVDLSVYLREPGQEYKATIYSETRAAAAGGVTTLVCPPDTSPVVDNPGVVEHIQMRAQQAGFSKVLPLGALTQALEGKQISEMHALKQAGCVAVSNARCSVSDKVMRRALEYAASQGIRVFVQPQDSALAGQGCAHEGAVSIRLGLQGIPHSAETVAVAKLLQLVELTGARLHFQQLSTARAVQMVARARYDGLPVTVDVSAHHLFLTEMDIGFFDSQCHVMPPLRTQRDRDALRTALSAGTIDAVCSDHQPHDVDAKLAPFPATEPGMSTVETLLPLLLKLVDEKILSLNEAIGKITSGPADVLGVNAGDLSVGNAADICVFNPEHYWQISPDTLMSSGKNTAFMDMELKGKVSHTLLDGRLVHTTK